MKKIKRREKGITLIALVITIIVLLILAGVTIATLTGDNRNLNKGDRSEKGDRKGKSSRGGKDRHLRKADRKRRKQNK